MYPEVKQFIAARKAAEDAWGKACDVAEAVYAAAAEAAGVAGHGDSVQTCPRCEFGRGPEGLTRSAAMGRAQEAYEAAGAAAWDALTSSADPLVRWIAVNCRNYADSAEDVLRTLPAPMDALDDLADRKDWCGVYRSYRAAAEAAGVLPAATAVAPESEVTA